MAGLESWQLKIETLREEEMSGTAVGTVPRFSKEVGGRETGKIH